MKNCPDCDPLMQKQRNYELAQKLVELHKKNVVFFKDNHGFYRFALESEYDKTAGTVIEILRYKRPPAKKL